MYVPYKVSIYYFLKSGLCKSDWRNFNGLKLEFIWEEDINSRSN